MPETEGVFVRYAEVVLGETVAYEYFYEYEVNGKRYEFKHDFKFFSKIPLYDEEKIRVRYNPENPKEKSYMIDQKNLKMVITSSMFIVFSLLLLLILRFG